MDQVLPSEKDVAFFKEQGYWVSPKIISDERLAEIIEHSEKVYDGIYERGRAPWSGWTRGDNPRALRKTDNSHWADNVLMGVATDPVIGEIAARLMETDCIRLWHDQLLYKPGRGPGKETANVGWHQDYSYWQCAAEPSLVTAWVAFTDVDLTNGCMQVIPRSHRWGLRRISDFFEQDLEKQQREMDLPDGEAFVTQPLIMKAGQVSFHHALTVHGSGANMTDQPRRSMAVHLMTGDTRYRKGSRSEGHMNVQLLNGSDGDIFQGEPFPVLYSRIK
ncbi:phytanoyl-CoA dioxygenase family protein [Paenibacillus thermotolerans]|uniref:phytanoyl-CoA dioxygenase family protein n=1 Tax=Paenibacillus thermotolerans TaxID=3027807 RepID=UPI002367EAA5|nr:MULTISPECIES: phytanoyl-CoA dioxygenase family protein [unclassified Paenibacillus]